jgi:hypothetical protein
MHGVRLKPFKCIRIINDTNGKLLTHREILEAQGNKFFTVRVHVQNNTGSHRLYISTIWEESALYVKDTGRIGAPF